MMDFQQLEKTAAQIVADGKGILAADESDATIKKLTRAMELIAASRIVKAQQRAQAAGPYARELTRAVSAVEMWGRSQPLT